MLLFVNACLREGSRTERLARMWLERRAYEGERRAYEGERRAYEGELVELSLGQLDVKTLDADGSYSVGAYGEAVKEGDYSHPMFDFAKQFAEADEVLIAAPFWNYSVPAKLHGYLEMVCSQGVTFDVDETGAYVSLIKAQRLTYIVTAGGAAVDALDDHAFGYVRTLAEQFWHIPQIDCVAAWSLDAPDADVDACLAAALG